jgi:hypothetical protein
MKKNIYIMILLLSLSWACNDDEFLNKKPTNILLNDQVWQDPGLVLSVLADLYDRYPDFQHLQNTWAFGDFNEAFISRNGAYDRFKNNDYGIGLGFYWDYAFVRELNLFIEKAQLADKLTTEDRDRFLGEARFLRAAVYFELVKRMGGVPLILEPMEYDFSGDPTYLQTPRAKEHEVYDFVISELEAVKTLLPDNASIKGRATKGAALAVESRAALYAGSIARYNANTPSVQTANGEVGIPASMAEGYYQTALRAAQEITGYSLYKVKPDLEENFASLFLDKNNNSEVIFVEDYLNKQKTHQYTVANQPVSLTEETFGGEINPSLNLVMEYEKLDNSLTPLEIGTGTDYVYYENPEDLFSGRDARLGGTVMYPGSTFKSAQVDIWGGYKLEDGSVITGTNFNAQAQLPGQTTETVVVGRDGPISGLEWSAQTGFLIRKYVDPNAGAGSIGSGSEVWWIRYRYAEVLLNAAEAAFELNDKGTAATFINQVRERAGFTIPLTADEITFDRIVHERKVELAFEDHFFWDMKRWRLADIVWDGTAMTPDDLVANVGKADKKMTQVFSLIPYRFYAPGNPNDGKYVFEISKPNPVTGADRFQQSNYYSEINFGLINANPKLVRNPNH